MHTLVVDCPTGLAGDMLLAASLDLGVPRQVITDPLAALGFGDAYRLVVEESTNGGLRGLQLDVEPTTPSSHHRHWRDLREQISAAPIAPLLKQRVLAVFSALAEAEAAVHGTSPDNVHFHEVGAIDSLVDVVGVCAAITHLAPQRLLCQPPPAGRGTVETAHGCLPVPVPAVLELARRHRVPLRSGPHFPGGELTTPTGLALMAVLADAFATGLPYMEPAWGSSHGGEQGLQGTRPAEVLKLWLGLRQLGEEGISALLTKALQRRQHLQSQLDSERLLIRSGALHVLACCPHGDDASQIETWSRATRQHLLDQQLMLSRPLYAGQHHLKAVLGNPHTRTSHLDQLAEILNASVEGFH